MNEKSATVLRCVVAGWLVYTGVSLIYDVVRAKPNNMVLMICFGAFFTVFGIGFAVLTIRRYRADSKTDDQVETEEVDEDSSVQAVSVEAGDEEEGSSSVRHGVGVANVDLKASVNANEKPESENVSESEDAEAGQADEPLPEPEEDTSKTELTAEETV